jgi:hypothetical protein
MQECVVVMQWCPQAKLNEIFGVPDIGARNGRNRSLLPQVLVLLMKPVQWA